MVRILTWPHSSSNRNGGIDDRNVDIDVEIYKDEDVYVVLYHVQEGFHVTWP